MIAFPGMCVVFWFHLKCHINAVGDEKREERKGEVRGHLTLLE